MKKQAKGFTLIELMIVVAIIGILAAVAIPAFMKYIRRSKTVEAAMNVRKLYDATVAYYEAEHASAAGGIVAKQFPSGVAWNPAQGACCAQVGKKCDPTTVTWNGGTWQALTFSVDDPFYYSYETVNTTGTGAAAGDIYNLQASADLNCDGTYSLFQRTSTVMADFSISGGSGLYILRELD